MITSQINELKQFLSKNNFHFASFEKVSSSSETFSLDSKSKKTFNESEVILNCLIDALGLCVVKISLGCHGDDYTKVKYFFISQNESDQNELNQLEKKYRGE